MLYPQLLKDDFKKLPGALHHFHSMHGGGRAIGMMAVRHSNLVLAWLGGFPQAGDQIRTQVTVIAVEDREMWVRRFGDQIRTSYQWIQGELLLEQLGPVRVAFRVSANEEGMRFESQRATVWGIPVPLRVTAEARGDEASWRLRVAVAHVGSYEGVMEPVR